MSLLCSWILEQVSAISVTDMTILYRLNAAEQRELQSRMEKKQMKEFMTVCITTNPSGQVS